MTKPGFACVLVATDFSPCAEEAWIAGQRLARALGAELVLLHVAAEPAFYSGAPFARGLAREAEVEARKTAQEELAQRVEAARATGLRARNDLRSGDPAQGIVDAATQIPADLIVLGTHGGIKRALLGSVADRVIRVAPCPVVAVHERS